MHHVDSRRRRFQRRIGEDEDLPHNRFCFPPNLAPLKAALQDSDQAVLFRLTLALVALTMTMGIIANFGGSDVLTFVSAIIIGTSISFAVYRYSSRISEKLAKASLYIF